MSENANDEADQQPAEPPRRRVMSEATAWRRPRGVAPGTWRYVHEGSIAARYDDFVASTPLCHLDLAMIPAIFPDRFNQPGGSESEVVSAKMSNPTASRADYASASRSAGATNRTSNKSRVLDLGCGTGRATEVLVRLGYEVLAVDLSEPMLRQVLARGLSGVHAFQANLVELDGFADSVATGAVCLFSTLGMIQGRENRRRFLSHVRRIVRPGGEFMLHVHHRYASLTSLPGCRQLAVTAIRTLTRKGWEFGDAVYAYRGLPDMFLHQFSRRELAADFRSTGWQVSQWANLSLDSSHIVRGRQKIAGGFLIVLR